MAQLDEGDRVDSGRDHAARWFRVDVHDAGVRELADALAGTGCLVVTEDDGLRVAVPGIAASEAETSLRFFLGSWKFGTAAALRTPPRTLAL